MEAPQIYKMFYGHSEYREHLGYLVVCSKMGVIFRSTKQKVEVVSLEYVNDMLRCTTPVFIGAGPWIEKEN